MSFNGFDHEFALRSHDMGKIMIRDSANTHSFYKVCRCHVSYKRFQAWFVAPRKVT